MRSSLFPALLGVALSGCLFIPVDSRLQNQNPTYPDGGLIPLPDGGRSDNNNNTGAGVLNSVSFTGTSINGSTVGAGQTFVFTAIVQDSLGNAIVDGVSYNWAASPNGVISIGNPNGQTATVTAQTVSQTTGVTLTLTVSHNGRSMSFSVEFSVQGTQQNNTITSLQIGGTGETLLVGQGFQGIFVRGFNSEGAAIMTYTSAEWSSSNSSVITVTPTNGTANANVSAVGPGTAQILVTAGGLSTSATVTVYRPSIALTPSSCTNAGSVSVGVGNTQGLYAGLFDGSNCTTPAVSWSSSDSSKASVNPLQNANSTVLTGVAAGSTTVTANFNGGSQTITVTVPGGNMTNGNQHIVRVVSSALQCGDAATGQYTSPTTSTSFFVAAVTGDAGGCNYSNGYFFTWATQNGEVATVQPTMAGTNFATVTIPPSASGKTKITVTGTGGDGGSFYAEFEIIIGGA